MTKGRRLGTFLGSTAIPPDDTAPENVASEPTKPSASPRQTPVASAAVQEQQGIGTNDGAERIKNVAAEYVLTAKLSKYLKLSPEILDEESNLLAGLKASTVEVICEEPRVRAIRLGNGATIGARVLAGDSIYERDFYPQLVRDIRTAYLRVLLLGNSGVGKSTFQYYFLARYLNPAQFQDIGAAPPTRRIQFGSASPPKVVIRHFPGTNQFYVLFLEECVAHKVSSVEVLWCFDPATTLYFFEPGGTATIEPHFENLALPTLATMSPNIAGYKQFRKDAATMYCPVYTKEELLAIGRDMRQARGFPSDLADVYSDANISERFDAFNGIFRYVLPQTAEEAVSYLKEQEVYLENTRNAADLIDEDPSVMVERKAGSFALMYDVGHQTNGEWNFFEQSFMYAGPHVVQKVRTAYTKKKFADVLFNVRYADELNVRTPEMNMWMFEEVVARFLTTGKGVRWVLRRVGKSSVVSSPVLEEKLKGPIMGFPPSYDKMRENTLYRSVMPDFPFCDMMYKDTNGTLVCIQVSWKSDREVKDSPFQEFCHAVGLCAKKPDEGCFTTEEERWAKEHVFLVFCPRPRFYDDAKLTFKCFLEGGAIVRMGEGFTSWIDENGDSS